MRSVGEYKNLLEKWKIFICAQAEEGKVSMPMNTGGFLRRVEGVLVSPTATFDSIIERRPALTEPMVIFLSFGAVALLINGIAGMLTSYARFPLPVLPASLLSPFINAGVSCFIIFLILRALEKLKPSRWRMDLGLLYTLLGFSAIPLLISGVYSQISLYAVSALVEKPSGNLLFLSKIPSVLFTFWFAYLLSLSLNRHYFRDASPRENMASILLGAFLILGVFNLLNPSALYSFRPLFLAAAISWPLLGAISLAVWERAGRYPRARLAVIGALGIVVLANSGLLYLAVSEHDARMVETMRTAEVEFKIIVLANGDIENATVQVPLPLFRNQPLDLSTAEALHEQEPSAHWGLTSFPLMLSPEEKPKPIRNQGRVVIEDKELRFVIDEFTSHDNRSRPPVIEGDVVATQHGEYVTLSISEIYDSEGISIGFKFTFPRKDQEQIGFPQPALLYGDFGKCMAVEGNEMCDLRVHSNIRASLQVSPNYRSDSRVETLWGVFNETRQGWIRAEVFEPRG